MATIRCHLFRGNFEVPQDAGTVKSYVQEAVKHRSDSRLLQVAFLGSATVASLGQTFFYGGKTLIEPILFSLDGKGWQLLQENGVKAIQSICFVAFGSLITMTTIFFPNWSYSCIEIHLPVQPRLAAVPVVSADSRRLLELEKENARLRQENRRLVEASKPQAQQLRVPQIVHRVDVEARAFQESVMKDREGEVRHLREENGRLKEQHAQKLFELQQERQLLVETHAEEVSEQRTRIVSEPPERKQLKRLGLLCQFGLMKLRSQQREIQRLRARVGLLEKYEGLVKSIADSSVGRFLGLSNF